jgi:hypothetical protein
MVFESPEVVTGLDLARGRKGEIVPIASCQVKYEKVSDAFGELNWS